VSISGWHACGFAQACRSPPAGKGVAMTIASAKQHFLTIGKVNTCEQAARHSLQAALQTRGGKRVYIAGAFEDKRAPFRKDFVELLRTHAEQCMQIADESALVDAIESISIELSQQYAGILCDGCLRIGITQKAFNLYLKYKWCLDSTWPTPAHCPIDGLILQAAGIPGSWTSLTSLAMYREWISALRIHAKMTGYSSLAEWELNEWDRSRSADGRSTRTAGP